MNETPSTIQPIQCCGDSRSMGLAQGARLRENLPNLQAALWQIEAFRLRRPTWLPYRFYRCLAERTAARYLNRALRHDTTGIRERLTGIVEGANARRQNLCLFNALEPFLSTVGGCIGAGHACSAVAVRRSRSATGEPIIGRNFDYLDLIKPFHVVRQNEPSNGLRSLEFTVAPLAGTMDGVNEAGLCITYDYAYTLDEAPEPAPTISMIISTALERCRTVEEALCYIVARRRWGAALLMLADEGGDIASLELSSTRSAVRRPGPDQDFCFHTNRFQATETIAVQAPADSVLDHRAPAALQGHRLHESAERRDARWKQLLDGNEAFTVEALAALLADHGTDQKPSAFAPCVHSPYWNTTTCLQLLPRSRQLRIAFDRPCRAVYQVFRI